MSKPVLEWATRSGDTVVAASTGHKPCKAMTIEDLLMLADWCKEIAQRIQQFVETWENEK